MTTPAEPRLRGHHFVCLQFFHGVGYSARFVEHLERVIAATTDTAAELVEGVDDVCAECPGRAPDGMCMDPTAGEIEVRRIDRLAWTLLDMRPSDRLSLAEARVRLSADAIAVGRWRFEACVGCTWEDVCEEGWDALLDEAD